MELNIECMKCKEINRTKCTEEGEDEQGIYEVYICPYCRYENKFYG